MSDRPRRISVVISASPEAEGGIDGVAQALGAHGLGNMTTLHRIGIITGDADPGRLGALASVPGVVDVREEQNLPPPPTDRDIPQ